VGGGKRGCHEACPLTKAGRSTTAGRRTHPARIVRNGRAPAVIHQPHVNHGSLPLVEEIRAGRVIVG
ncbi:hypothetical protein, partial [Escherichia coli]|uniref:hypothetical protein n=1 Tax=Escherichia coli TaxID=562 RepID=UPI001954D1BA